LTRRIAVVFAHPDDETFCTGGTIAKYCSEGIATDLFCATNGDAGKTSGVPVSSREELARIRQDELRNAARVLGIESIELAGYTDGTLHELEPTKLIGDVVAFLRRTKPTIVIGFGPEGAPTGHRDHRAMSRVVTAAFFLSGLKTAYPEQVESGFQPHRADRLYYHAWKYPHKDPRLKLESVPATVAIDNKPWLDRKLSAFKEHKTQQYAYELFVNDVLLDYEYYAFAAGTPQPNAMDDDLFSGL
jgi:LmbE family N-acetylglucosaminyl deacetylase